MISDLDVLSLNPDMHDLFKINYSLLLPIFVKKSYT
jgi:hypothetical protein